VPVVQVRIVRMLMRENAVAVFVRVGLRSVPRKIVLMLVMCVVDVRVRVRECFVPAMKSASADDTFRVRLLSIAQQRQAAAMEALELVTTVGSCLDRDNADHAGESRLGPHG